MKICVYTIAKNEEKFAARWYAAASKADYVVVGDTGSTDGTVKVLEELGASVYAVNIAPWRFDDARNAVLGLVPADTDLCIALDMDEVLQDGWREALEAVSMEVSRPRYRYIWSWNADGSEGLTYWGDKIHKRHGYRWKLPVHEVLVPSGQEVHEFVPGLEIHHHADLSKPRTSYLPLLELAHSEDSSCTRTAFYLGREYFYAKRYQACVDQLKKFLAMPGGWSLERSHAMRIIGDVTTEESWYLKAAAEAPHMREPWVSLSIWHHDRKNWLLSKAFAVRALNITVKPELYLCEAASWGDLPSRLVSIADSHLSSDGNSA